MLIFKRHFSKIYQRTVLLKKLRVKPDISYDVLHIACKYSHLVSTVFYFFLKIKMCKVFKCFQGLSPRSQVLKKKHFQCHYIILSRGVWPSLFEILLALQYHHPSGTTITPIITVIIIIIIKNHYQQHYHPTNFEILLIPQYHHLQTLSSQSAAGSAATVVSTKSISNWRLHGILKVLLAPWLANKRNF